MQRDGAARKFKTTHTQGARIMKTKSFPNRLIIGLMPLGAVLALAVTFFSGHTTQAMPTTDLLERGLGGRVNAEAMAPTGGLVLQFHYDGREAVETDPPSGAYLSYDGQNFFHEEPEDRILACVECSGPFPVCEGDCPEIDDKLNLGCVALTVGEIGQCGCLYINSTDATSFDSRIGRLVDGRFDRAVPVLLVDVPGIVAVRSCSPEAPVEIHLK